MFEEKPNQEAVAEKIDVELFKRFCFAIGLSAGEVAQIMKAPDEPAKLDGRINARR